MNKKFIQFIASIFLANALLSCARDDISYRYPDNQDYARQNRAGNILSKKDLIIFGDEKQSSEEFKNSKLWTSSVALISELFPIAIIDEDSGVIASDWKEKGASRTKINVLIKGSAPTNDNLRVSIFSQTKTAEGQWQSDTSDNSETTKMIRDKILQKARAI